MVLIRCLVSQGLEKAKQEDGKIGFQTRLTFYHWRQGERSKQDHHLKFLAAVVSGKGDASFLSIEKS